MIVLGPTVFDELARIGIHPAIDNVEAYVDLLLHGAAQPEDANGGDISMTLAPNPPAARHPTAPATPRRPSKPRLCARTSARSTPSTAST